MLVLLPRTRCVRGSVTFTHRRNFIIILTVMPLKRHNSYYTNEIITVLVLFKHDLFKFNRLIKLDLTHFLPQAF